MKKIFAIVVLSLSSFTVFSQVNSGLRPYSKTAPDFFLLPPAQLFLPEFDLREAEKADRLDERSSSVPVFSRSVLADINLQNSGEWIALPNGNRVWRLQITSSRALALLPYFDKFYLPPGAMLHVYTPDAERVIGAFTSANNPADGHFATGLIHGESCILEYFEPREVKGLGNLHLNEIGHAYRLIDANFSPWQNASSRSLGFNTSGNCEVNVNCTEGAAWQDQKRAVACIIVKSGFNQILCTGSLVNNVRQDCTPYLLSAQHCSTGASPGDFSQWLFYFNYESPGCSNPDSLGSLDDQFVTGCTKKADSQDAGGNTGSDFLLLQLNHLPPNNYNVFYAGWNRVNSASASGVCIQHPKADLKKISTYTRSLIDTTWGFVTPHTHWLVYWASTINGYGITEFGSSGSPLFNSQGQIVGALTGGSASSSCTNPGTADYFGKVAFDWTSNGTTTNVQLKPWLDPDNTGTSSLNGKNAGCPSGFEESYQDEIEFKVMPNPSSGIFNLFFTKEEEKNIRVLDALGRIVLEGVFTEKYFSLNLSLAHGGIYILQAETKSGRSSRMLVLAKDQ